MKLVTYESRDGARAGVLTDAGIIDAWRALGEPDLHSLRELLKADHVGALAETLDGRRVDAPADARLRTPVSDPEKIICIGLNYRAHAAEAGIDEPTSPTIFGKFRNALAAPGATVTLPRASSKVDFEAEIAVVIGRQAKEVSESHALEHVAGYMLLNDLSARDLQFATPQWMAGKVFDGSAPTGPALVTPNEAGPHDRIEFALTLNGEEMQSASTSDLIFGMPRLVSHLSTLMTLEPGDIIATGTPSGVGGARTPRVWLKDGDEIEITSPTLGTLRTKIAR